MIPYSRQHVSNDDIDAVIKVLRSDFLTQGPVLPQFEQAVADYCGGTYGVAVNSATSALHIACLALGLGPGDWLWTSPNSFVATANCALYCGAKVDFVDIDPRSYNLCPQKLEQKLLLAEKNGTLPKVVIPVHFAGQPCDMAAICALGQKYGFKIIEDASHAIGASRETICVGACAHSDITVFSFHPVKIITSGEGGMAMTNSDELAARMRRLRAHGITTNGALMRPQAIDEIWNYQQIELGFNYRMTDIQAALGTSQLERVTEFVSRRTAVAKRYHEQLQLLPVTTPFQEPTTCSSYHLYPIRITDGSNLKTQREIYDSLSRSGIAVNVHYIPIHRQPFYEKLGFPLGAFPEAERFHREAISLPIYPSLSFNDQSYVIECLKREFGS